MRRRIYLPAAYFPGNGLLSVRGTGSCPLNEKHGVSLVLICTRFISYLHLTVHTPHPAATWYLIFFLKISIQCSRLIILGGFFMSIFHSIKESAALLKGTKNIVTLGMILAVSMVVNVLAIQITPTLRLTFNFLVYAVCGALFGPVPSLITFMVSDVLSYMINSHGGMYFFGFTLNAGLAGLIYGIILFRKNFSIWRCIIVKSICSLFLNVGLSTIWLHMLYGNAIAALFWVRLIKNLMLLPIEILLLAAVLKGVQKILVKQMPEKII